MMRTKRLTLVMINARMNESRHYKRQLILNRFSFFFVCVRARALSLARSLSLPLVVGRSPPVDCSERKADE